MSFRKLLKKYGVELERSSPSQLLHALTRELRSDHVPAVLRDAAHAVASLLEGEGSSSQSHGGANGVTINVTIAVAVGAPG